MGFGQCWFVNKLAMHQWSKNNQASMKHGHNTRHIYYSYSCFLFEGSCYNNDCKNGATCEIVSDQTYACACLEGYYGITCQSTGMWGNCIMLSSNLTFSGLEKHFDKDTDKYWTHNWHATCSTLSP